MKFLVPNYSCLHNPWLGGYRLQIPVLSVVGPQLNLLNPPEQNSWVRDWLESYKMKGTKYEIACHVVVSSALFVQLTTWWRRTSIDSVYIDINAVYSDNTRYFFPSSHLSGRPC